MSKINGYIEVDGVINKITSVEDLKNLVEGLGKEFKEMTKADFERLTSELSELPETKDDCGVKYRGNVLMHSTSQLAQYKVKEGTKVISSNAFYYANYYGWHEYYVDKLFLPKSLICVGESAFYNNRITDLMFSDSLKFIGEDAFRRCANLKISVLPKGLIYLEANAFEGCSSIKSIIFQDNIKEIDSHAFKGCASLEYAYIPDSLEYVGSGIFDDCPNFKNVFIPRGSMEKFKGFFPFDIDKLVEVDEVPTFEDK